LTDGILKDDADASANDPAILADDGGTPLINQDRTTPRSQEGGEE
jgi:hypothetical protein